MAPMKSMKAMKTMKAAPRKKAMKAMKGAPMKTAMKAKKGSRAMKAMKAMKAAPMTVVTAGDYEVALIVCHRCRVAREICGINMSGMLTFQNYYCCVCAGSLTIASAVVKPTQ